MADTAEVDYLADAAEAAGVAGVAGVGEVAALAVVVEASLVSHLSAVTLFVGREAEVRNHFGYYTRIPCSETTVRRRV